MLRGTIISGPKAPSFTRATDLLSVLLLHSRPGRHQFNELFPVLHELLLPLQILLRLFRRHFRSVRSLQLETMHD